MKEASHRKKQIIGFHLYQMSRIGKPKTIKSRLMYARRWGKKEWGVTVNGYGVSLWGDENDPKLTVSMIAQFYGYTKNHRIVHFK